MIAQEIIRRGHMIGNHTVNHLQLPTLEDAQVAYEVDGAAHIIEQELGTRPWLIQPPGGSRSARIDALLAQRGYTIVLWNIGAGDFQVHSARVVYEIFFKVLERREQENGERGRIVLLHDTYTHTIEAFPQIIAELKRRNCDLFSQRDELYDFVPDLHYFYEPSDALNPSNEALSARIHQEDFDESQSYLRQITQERCQQ